MKRGTGDDKVEQELGASKGSRAELKTGGNTAEPGYGDSELPMGCGSPPEIGGRDGGARGRDGNAGVGRHPRSTRVAECFEDLHVYQRARELTNAVYALTRQGAFTRDFGLADQVRRAAVSVMSNIAEGFERGTKVEFIQFLFIAKGSCGEVRAQLQVAGDQGYTAPDETSRLRELARLVGGMLSNFIAHLQGSAYQGEKYARPRRLAAKNVQESIEALRRAQEVNIRAREERERKKREEQDGGGEAEGGKV